MQYYRKIVTSLSDRAIIYGRHIVRHSATVRDTADFYGVGKSSVHTAVTKHLKAADSNLYEKVQTILAHNKAVSHIHGGEVIRQRYAKN
jgi:putative DeoR family transcriptional regulator (stage III sporulation protein D)